MKKFIKSLELRWSDLFLLIGFIPFALFLVFGQELMQHQNPAEVNFSLPAIIICFIISAICWGFYLFLEKKRGNVKFGYIGYILLFLLILNVIVIAAQPSSVSLDVVCRNVNETNTKLYPGIQINDLIKVTVELSPIHKTFFALDIILIISFIFIGLFVFPKRFKSISFIKYLGYAVFAFIGVLCIYSYITEFNLYGQFIDNLIHPKFDDAGVKIGQDVYAVKSFILHRNAFGMSLLMGIIFAIINHSIDKKWYNYLLMGFFFVQMIFTWSKTSLLIGALIIVIYVYFRLIYDFEKNKKRNIILLTTYSSIIVIGGGLVAISLITKGQVLGSIYSMFKGGETLDLRSFIWDNCYNMLGNGNWVVGRGFGLFNVILYPMNDVNGDHVFPSHSSFVNMITEGGIFFLLAYIALVVYSGIIIVKSYKKNPNLVFAMGIGALSFFLYSFIETIHYLFYVFLLPIFIFYEVEKKKEQIPSNEIAVQQ